MGTERTTERQVFWRSKQHGWVDRELPDVTHQLTCVADTQHVSHVHNKLQARDPRGGWTDLTRDEEARMPAMDRGFSFTVKPRQGDNQSFMEIRCKRFVDREMVATLLDGLTIYDRELEPMPNPEMAINRFCLATVEADTFFNRVKERGGQITEAQADLKNMYAMLTQMLTLAQELERLCQVSRGVIDKIAEGIQTEAPSISERSKTAHYIREQAADLVDKIRDEQLALDRHPGQVDAKAYGVAYLESAEKFFNKIERLHAEHRSYERQAVNRIKETLSQSLPSADQPAVTRRYLMMAVVEYYTDLGYDARLTEDGMILHVDGGVVELGAKPRIIGANAEPAAPQSGDLLFGRHTAERGQREL